MVTEWVRYWSRMGDLCMHRGDDELEAQRLNRACESYLVATDYYGLALSRSNHSVPEGRVLADAHMSAFRTAMPLLPHRAASFELEVEDTRVTGYLFQPTCGADPCRPVVWSVERGATAESSYRRVALAVLQADLACAVFSVDDGEPPRTGPSSRRHALQRAVMQWVRQQPGVDPDVEPLQAPIERN